MLHDAASMLLTVPCPLAFSLLVILSCAWTIGNAAVPRLVIMLVVEVLVVSMRQYASGVRL